MLKFIYLFFSLMFFQSVYADYSCDIRPGISIGIKVLEFVFQGKMISKIPFKESTPMALKQELTNLQDIGVCEDKFNTLPCTLRWEKKLGVKVISFYRGTIRWNSWNPRGKDRAELFLKGMNSVGLCDSKNRI